ncbi:ABC-type multidrug transport system ATPase component [Levilactobacillus brevis]|uniref:Abi-alpha family protein n=1 Tax=Levilactobacillus brevis TaxID=1580 RepID=UPI000B360368|nr:Abi-alpha family protein [Levilactobacillus brevis]QCZ47331.1 ABC-type multidrug transport system ATPase component [Levilactobacillus brevis]
MDSSFFVNNVLVPFSASLAGNAGGNALKPIFKMLDNWFYITFGSDLDFEVKKKKLEQAHRLDLYEVELNKAQNIGKFQKDVVDLLNDIDYSDLVIPDKKTLAQIMSVLPTYLDIDDTRLLLTKVVTASCDRSRNDFVHPSIIEIIKQLTGSDIKLIRRLYRSLGFAASVRMRPVKKMDDPTDFCPISINGQEIPKRLYFTVREGDFDIKNGPLWISSEDIFTDAHLSNMPIHVLKRLGIIDEIEYRSYEEKSIVRVQDFVENSVSEVDCKFNPNFWTNLSA